MQSNCRRSSNNLIQREQLRQARWAFNVAISFTIMGGVISLLGVLLLFTGKLPNGTLTAASGFLSNLAGARCFQLSKEANERLNKQSNQENSKIQAR